MVSGSTESLLCSITATDLGESFNGYADYFNGHQDDNAICYLTLANEVIHQFNPQAITIAEEVSGMPGLASPFKDGGYGFDYRMAMNIPDYWIKTIKELKDEDWKPSSIFWELTNRRADESNISYTESHDQALVGDKTIIFRLIDADMYWHFRKGDENERAHRGIALHKMIRLVTASTINGGYLNFMGNEFGHPEWVDFPREGNGWSHKYARRQWHLVDDKELCYHCSATSTSHAPSAQKRETVPEIARNRDLAQRWRPDFGVPARRSAFRLQLLAHHIVCRLWFHGETGSIQRGAQHRCRGFRRARPQ